VCFKYIIYCFLFSRLSEDKTYAVGTIPLILAGKRLMGLTKPELMSLVNNKIGPCLKIENLLSLLKVNAANPPG
jgi:hypothetical protein